MGNISKEELMKICKVGQGSDCCRYVGFDKFGSVCLKNTDLAKVIDRKVNEMSAKSINCDGKKEEEIIP